MYNICLGTAQLGMDYGIANKIGQPSFHNACQIIKYAIDNNIVFFDTAVAYGESEIVLGNCLQMHNNKNKVNIITKLEPNFTFNTYSDLKKAIANSCRNLGSTNLWGLMQHRININGDMKKFAKAILKAKQNKLLTKFGVSIYTPSEANIALAREEIDIMQIPSNILDKRWLNNNFFAKARKRNVQLFVRSTLLQGLILLNKEQLKKAKMGWSYQYLKPFIDFTDKYHLNKKQFAFQALLSIAKDAILVIGVETKKQLQENINILELPKIPQAIIDEWWQTLPILPEKFLNPALWHRGE